LALSILEILLQLLSCINYHASITKHVFDIPKDNATIIFCLGDSFTYGVGAGFNHSYPAQLESILNSQPIDRKFRVYNLGIPGYDSDQVLLKLKESLDNLTPDYVIILVGTNDYQTLDKNLFFSRSFFNLKTMPTLKHLRIHKLFKIILANLKGRDNTIKSNIDLIKEINKENNLRSNKFSILNADKSIDDKIDFLVDLLKKNPLNGKIYAELDPLFIQLNNIKKTISIYKSLRWRFPNNEHILQRLSQAYKHLAGSLLIQHKYKKAAIYYQNAASIDSKNKANFLEMVRHISVFEFNFKKLDKMIKICKEQNINVILSGQPEFALMSAEYAAEKNTIPLIKHGAVFKNLFKNHTRSKYFVADGHCTKDGYNVIALNIAKEILRLQK